MHENDFGGNRFVWHSIAAGMVAGLILYNFIKLQKPNWTDNPKMSAEIGFYFVLAGVYLCVVFGPLINRKFATAAAVCTEYPLLRADSKFIHVSINGRKERFDPPPAVQQALSNNQRTVILCVRKGYLGYQYVERFDLSKASR
ncbi:MAG TPA: hypothetical protein VD996_01975 [Chitinophagaceae bacterium]|nr:hypothetical protein [Chitinophagaceae bacterium]